MKGIQNKKPIEYGICLNKYFSVNYTIYKYTTQTKQQQYNIKMK